MAKLKGEGMPFFERTSIDLPSKRSYTCGGNVKCQQSKGQVFLQILHQFSVPSNIMVKICQIPHVIFQTTDQFFSKFYMTFQSHERQLFCTF